MSDFMKADTGEFDSRVIERLVGQVIEPLIRVETKLDNMTKQVDAHESRIVMVEKGNPYNDHESRIRRLERAIYLASGAAAAGGGVLGSFLSSLGGL